MLPETIGILSLGEMGEQWARVLSSCGVRICTCSNGRSHRTVEAAQRCGASQMENVETLVEASDLIVSLVPAGAALDVACRVAHGMKTTGKSPLFLEANAISPSKVQEIAALVTEAGGECIDGGVIGAATRLTKGTFTVLSGPRAHELEVLGSLGLAIEVVGDKVGQASALKMFNAGFFHGVTTLMLDLLFGAARLGILPQVLWLYERRCPDMLRHVAPLIETTRRHGQRRSCEMAELLEALSTVDFDPRSISTSRDILGGFAHLEQPQSQEWDEIIATFTKFSHPRAH